MNRRKKGIILSIQPSQRRIEIATKPPRSRQKSKSRPASAYRPALIRGEIVDKRYSAPALEKGLAILEVVSGSSAPLTTEAIASAVGRSRNEIYRMLLVLESRGYLARDAATEGYVLTSKMFALGMRRPPTTNLIVASLPEMRLLADEIGQSVRLVVASGDQIVFIAGVDSVVSFGLAVHLGYQRPVLTSNSGRLLYAFQPPERQASWLEQLRKTAPADANLDSFVADAKRARRDGWLVLPSMTVEGVTDVCAPIWSASSVGCAANLIVPYIRIRGQNLSFEDVAKATRQAADRITAQLRPHLHD